MTDQSATQATEPDDVDRHICKPGASVYYCPTSGETESDCHGGFDVCCARPDLHQPLLPCSTATLRQHPHGSHSWEPQPGMDPVHCEGYGDPAATDRPALENLDAALGPARWCCAGNAEDCPLCDTAALPYPWICPGHPQTADNERTAREVVDCRGLRRTIRQIMVANRRHVGQLTDAHQATIGELRRAEARVRELEAETALLRRYREWLADQLSAAETRDQAGGIPDQLKISPHNGIASGIRTALYGLDRIVAARGSEEPTRHVHITVRHVDEYTANRQALSLVDWVRAEFDGLDVTTDAREWDAADEEQP